MCVCKICICIRAVAINSDYATSMSANSFAKIRLLDIHVKIYVLSRNFYPGVLLKECCEILFVSADKHSSFSSFNKVFI